MVALGISWYFIPSVDSIPDSKIIPIARLDPVQGPTTAQKKTLTYFGEKYLIEPRAEYLLRGLVVSHNNIAGIGDMYHTRKSVDLKDICVVWGENIDNLKGVSFWSEPWSCHFYTRDSKVFESFRGDQISNTHLLGASEEVRRVIRSMHRGDQVELRGQLIDYAHVGQGGDFRRSSLVRNDTGNGACEVMLVEEARVLRAHAPLLYQLWDTALLALCWLVPLRILLFLFLPYASFKWG
jgi:hypothetical protein